MNSHGQRNFKPTELPFFWASRRPILLFLRTALAEISGLVRLIGYVAHFEAALSLGASFVLCGSPTANVSTEGWRSFLT